MKSGSEELKQAAEAVAALARRKEVGRAVKAELGEITAAIEEIRVRVAEIEDLYAIDFGSDVDSQIVNATQLWESAPSGKIADTALSEIRRVSPVLSTLFIKGIDLKSAYKFSPEQSRLAREVGTHFERTADVLRAFRTEKRNPDDPTEYSALIPMRRGLKATLLDLQKRGIIEGRRLLAKNKGNKWAPFELKWLRDEPDRQLLVVYEKKDPATVQFLKGEWLNCYVADIIRDQLARHEIAFELYTDLTYAAPADLIRSSSEFDVIGRFRDTIICVECKSGRLDAERGDFQDLIQRTEAVRMVLSSMGSGETSFLFFVVYDPVSNNEQAMTRELTPNSIKPLKPTEVRAVMAQILESSLS